MNRNANGSSTATPFALAWMLPCANRSLEDVYNLCDDNLTYTELDSIGGRGWAYVDGKRVPNCKFTFPKREAQTVYDRLTNGRGALKWVVRPYLMEDIKIIAPKLGVVVVTLHALRIVTQTALNNPQSYNLSKPPPPPMSKSLWKPNQIYEKKPTVNIGGKFITAGFQHVAGQKEAKQDLIEIIDFLKHPEKYHDIGARVPKGVLLSGVPGTGKTLIAKAVAGEAGVPFYSLSGSDFVEVFVGVGASRVRELFSDARKHDRAIIFIDEIDAIGKARVGGHGASEEREGTLNQLLIELDGFRANDNIIVIAATNQKHLLDPALTRAGRFDRAIECQLPTSSEREEVYRLNLQSMRLCVGDQEAHEGSMSRMSSEDARLVTSWIVRLASLCPLFSGAEIANVVNEAAIQAARKGGPGITYTDLEESIERVAFGHRKTGDMTKRNRLKRVSVHEAGHALCAWFLMHVDPPLKVSVIPRRNGMLGFAQQASDEEGLDTASKIKDRLVVLFGGRSAEELVFGEGSTGASDDYDKATKLAQMYVGSWGFSSEEAGLATTHNTTNTSDRMKGQYDQAISNLLKETKERADQLLAEKKDQLLKLTEKLMLKETVDFNEMYNVIGEKPSGEFSSAFLHYLKHNVLDDKYSELANL